MDRAPMPAESCDAIESWEWEEQRLSLWCRQGVMRIEALAPDILRVRFSPSGRFGARRSWDMVQLQETVPLELSVDPSLLQLRTESLSAKLSRDTGALCFFTPQGQPFGEDLTGPQWRDMALGEIRGLAGGPDAALPAGAARCGLFLDKRMAPQEGYFGFGQRTGKLNRRHRRLSNWTVDISSPGHCRGHDNLYQAHPVFLAARPGLAWGLFLHSTWYSAFDVGDEREDVLTLFTLGGELDYYLFAGPTPAAVVEQLTRVTGRPALPPLWSLGYHQSRWSYASDSELQAIAEGFRSRRIPLDAIHLDIDYMRDFRVFTWDSNRFPDPAATLAQLHGQNIRAVAIVDPGVKNDCSGDYAVASQGLAGDHFIHNPDGSLFTAHVWPGESLFPDFCRPDTRRWWGDLHAGLLEAGVDGIWCDMNEPSAVDRPFSIPGVKDKPMPLAAAQGPGAERAKHAEVHNLYGLLMTRAAAEGCLALRPDRRPWLLTRSAYTGIQRYSATWMGDNSSWWEHLEMSLPQLLNMGLCGVPHVGVDIGGFYHNAFAELYSRWMELGAFYPFMRCHTRTGSRPQEPWAFGTEIERVTRSMIELRYRLLPYLYTLAHQAHRSGAPLLRPLFYEFPTQAEYYELEDQLMLGPHLMVAPVCAAGVRRRLVELPEGVWYDYWSGTRVGPGPLVQEAPPGRPPLFVRGGSLLTLGNLRQSTAEPLEELTLEVFPGRPGDWTLVEDDGESFDYCRGELAETRFTLDEHGGNLLVSIDARRGAFQPPPRTLILRVHLPASPAGVTKDAEETWQWCWDQNAGCFELRWPDDGRSHRIEIRGGGSRVPVPPRDKP
jgi:alpha-glucosidase